jgi:hypothetical protein
MALSFRTFFAFGLVEDIAFTTKSIQCFFAVYPVHFGLLGILGNDIAAAGALSGKDFFNL